MANIIHRAASRVCFHVRNLYGQYIRRDPFTQALNQWHSDRGDETLRVDYPLSDSSIVFDLGGYRGRWAQQIWDRYQCHIYIFEPVPPYYRSIGERFIGRDKVHIYNFGLAESTRTDRIYLREEGSSLYGTGAQSLEIHLMDMAEFLRTIKIAHIDLMKINIEGAEYDLLDAMLSAGLVEICTNLQIQFHRFVPDAVSRRNAIRQELARTHCLTYDYPFIWENWKRY